MRGKRNDSIAELPRHRTYPKAGLADPNLLRIARPSENTENEMIGFNELLGLGVAAAIVVLGIIALTVFARNHKP